MINIKKHGSEENYDLDKISRLSDDVRIHILSFLSTREAVQTCILSKTWRKTWASVLDLNFDSKEFGLPEIIDNEMTIEFVTKFELLVKRVLEKREISRVNRFRLRLHFPVNCPRTQAIVDYIDDVMKLAPRECSVEMVSCKKMNLNTDLIFTCTSLIYLQLWFSNKSTLLVAIEPNSVNLPSLNTLVLVCVKMSNESLKKLLLGCPVLEELVLRSCCTDIVEICSNTLKKLVLRCYIDIIEICSNLVNLPCLKTLVLVRVKMSNESLKKLLLGCHVLEELVLRSCYIDIIEICSNTLKKLVLHNFDRLKILQIATPNLMYLDIKVNNMEEIMLPSMPSLVHASIFIPGLYVNGESLVHASIFIPGLYVNGESLVHATIFIPGLYVNGEYVTRGPQMINNLSIVQSLQLEFDYPSGKVLKKDVSDYPVFNNLKHLKLMNWSLYDFDLAPFFLHSPKLEELTLYFNGWVKQFLDEEATREGPRDALVQREFLKTVRIGRYMDRYINDNGFVDRLINKLFAHIKIIGEITLF